MIYKQDNKKSPRAHRRIGEIFDWSKEETRPGQVDSINELFYLDSKLGNLRRCSPYPVSEYF